MRYVADVALILIAGIIFIFALIGIECIFGERGNRPPVEGIELVDSLATTNDSIKLKINNLDSLKNAKVIEVYTLDSDSVVKLFYELVKE